MPRLTVLLFLAAVALLRLLLAGQWELSPDEAYYQMWSERLDWSYYSKGPGIAWTMRAATELAGVSELGVRWPAPVLGFLSAWILSSLARRCYGESAALWAAVLASVIPIFNVGGVLLTIDPLSIFFWTAALACLWRALEKSPRFSLWWPLGGLMIALGFLCKYTNAFQLLSLLLLLLWHPSWRRELRGAGWWSCVLVSLLGLVPPVIWNAEHEWITVTHLIERGGFDQPGKPAAILEFLGAQLGVYSPLVWIGLVVFGVLWGLRETRRSGRAGGATLAPRPEIARFLLAFAVPLLLFYTVLALRRPGEPNWTAPAFPSLLVLGAGLWTERAARSRGLRIFAAAGLALAVVMSALVLDTDLARRLGFNVPYKKDPSGRLRGWRATAEAVHAFRRQWERERGEKVFLIADKYQMCAELNFYLPERRIEWSGHPPVYMPEAQEIQNQFAFWGRYEELTEPDAAKAPARTPGAPANEQPEGLGESRFAGRSALFITDNPAWPAPPTSLERGFEEWKCVARFNISRRGQPLRTITIFSLNGYRGADL